MHLVSGDFPRQREFTVAPSCFLRRNFAATAVRCKSVTGIGEWWVLQSAQCTDSLGTSFESARHSVAVLRSIKDVMTSSNIVQE
jgi:hypothetical protein